MNRAPGAALKTATFTRPEQRPKATTPRPATLSKGAIRIWQLIAPAIGYVNHDVTGTAPASPTRQSVAAPCQWRDVPLTLAP